MNQQETDAMYMANKVVSLPAELKALGQWNEMTDNGRSAVGNAANLARDYIDLYHSDLMAKVKAAGQVA
jgi:hypothetical protein